MKAGSENNPPPFEARASALAPQDDGTEAEYAA